MSKVAGKVTKVESKGLYIKLENGKDAFLPKENMFIGKKKKLEEIFSVDFVIKAEEKSTNDSLVILTQKELKQAEGEKKKVAILAHDAYSSLCMRILNINIKSQLNSHFNWLSCWNVLVFYIHFPIFYHTPSIIVN